jgi:hypothetical protein
MNKEDNDDRLLRYLVSDTHESAPEGFTQKVMTRVTLERVTRATRYESPVKPWPIVVAGAITAIILLTLSTLQGSDITNSLSGFLSGIPALIDSILPDMQMPKSGGINIPAMFVYLSVSILLLTLFDRLLNSLFSKEKGKES